MDDTTVGRLADAVMVNMIKARQETEKMQAREMAKVIEQAQPRERVTPAEGEPGSTLSVIA